MGGGKQKKKEDAPIEEAVPSTSATAKFAVMDYPGQPQPATAAVAPSATTSKEGLQGRRAKSGSGPKMETSTDRSVGGDSFTVRTKDPSWLADRVAVYDTIRGRRQKEVAIKTAVPITVTLPDGNILAANKQGEPFQAWHTTPYLVACTISQGLAVSATVARVTYSAFVEDYSLSEDGMEGVDTLQEAMDDNEGRDSSSADKTFLWEKKIAFCSVVSSPTVRCNTLCRPEMVSTRNVNINVRFL